MSVRDGLSATPQSRALGHHLRAKGIPVIAVAPGWMHTELMMTHYTDDEVGFTGRTMDVWDLSQDYGFTDVDGTQPHVNAGRYR